MKYDVECFQTLEEVRQHIQNCESRHMQQVAYSTFHDGLTQICFGCQKIRTTLLGVPTLKTKDVNNE